MKKKHDLYFYLQMKTLRTREVKLSAWVFFVNIAKINVFFFLTWKNALTLLFEFFFLYWSIAN